MKSESQPGFFGEYCRKGEKFRAGMKGAAYRKNRPSIASTLARWQAHKNECAQCFWTDAKRGIANFLVYGVLAVFIIWLVLQ